MSKDLEDGDIAIIISPELDEDGTWRGLMKTS